MYCMKCGKEIIEGEQYCSGCGTKVGEVGKKQPSLNVTLPKVSGPNYQVGQIEGCKIAFLLVIILPIACLFLLKEVAWTVSVEILYYSESMEFGLLENSGFWSMVFYAGYIVAVCLLAAPIFTDGKWSTGNYIVGKIMPAAALIVVLIARIRINSRLYDNEYAEILRQADLEIEMSLTAWLFIAANIAMFMLISYVSKKTQEYQYHADKIALANEQEAEGQNATTERNEAVAQFVGYANEDWQCTCGRVNKGYVFSCGCGKGKRELIEESRRQMVNM